MEKDKRIDFPTTKVPQSARDYNNNENHSLRNFSGSPGRNNGSASKGHRDVRSTGLDSPTFISNQNISKKQSMIESIQHDAMAELSAKKSHRAGGDMNLMSARDHPDLQMIQEKFLSSQRV